MASRAERNAAMAHAGAQQVSATCPWGAGDNASEAGSQASSRQPSQRSTCPWTAEAQAAPFKPRVAPNNMPKDTCPWGNNNAVDLDSKRLAKAANLRTRSSPKNYGAAGSGAPKNPGGMMADDGINASPCFPREQPAEVTQNIAHLAPAPANTAQMFEAAPANEDDEQREQREIIEQCLAEGLDEDRILEILDDWQNNKLLQHTMGKMQSGPTQAVGSSMAVGGASLAASRQAKAQKNLSFGPSDEEIVDVLKDYSKENLTPPESPPNGLGMLAAKRAKARETSESAVGAFDSQNSRAAYEASKAQMDAVKNKNRMSSGIF